MCQPIAYVIGKWQRQFRMGCDEVGRNAFDVQANFSDDLEVAAHDSCRAGLGDDDVSEFVGQGAKRNYIDWDSQQVAQFVADDLEVKQGGVVCGVH